MQAILLNGDLKVGTVKLLLEAGADIFLQPESMYGADFLAWFWSNSSTWREFHRDITIDLLLQNFINPLLCPH